MDMKNIFEKDINRPINGVIKADQSNEAYNELDEYVLTKEVDAHLRKFVDVFIRGLDRKSGSPNEMGVWISGFFGSGKSHFLKILSYLLANKPVSDDQHSARTPLEFFLDKVTKDAAFTADLKRLAGAKTEVILFNIDSKAEQNHNRDAILQVFLKVFNEHVGYSGDHPEVAHMERFLDEKGRYEEFIAVLRDEFALDWRADRDSYQFYPTEIAGALSKVLGQKIEDPQAWIDNLEKGLSLNVDNFARWVKQYIDTKGMAQRLVFLVDEVGQFIGGQSKLMLNLQTITENLGTVCGGRAWVIVTSQEDMDAVVGVSHDKRLGTDFSKIQGRFATRLSLSGSNADEVIQTRLLKKTGEAAHELKALFSRKGDILKNQITFRDAGMTLKGFADEDNFAKCYPFPPYQFLLVQKMFEASRQFGAAGGHLSKGERSMLDAFQTAAKALQRQPISALVTLDAFYPSIESFLEGVVRVAINRVKSISGATTFDERVLKTLFLIRYIEEVPGNIDNLITFFLDEVDADKRALREKIEESLIRLEKETLISRNGELYFFLTNEERDINKEIKSLDTSPSETQRLLGEIVFEDVLKDLRRYRYLVNGKDFDIVRLCDLIPSGNRSEGGLVLSVVTPMAVDYSSFHDARCLQLSMEGEVGQVLIRLRDDAKLAEEIATYLKTEAYLRLKTDGSLSQTVKRIHDDKRAENAQRRKRIDTTLTTMMEEGKYFVLGSEKLFSGSPKAAVESAFHYLVENAFKKLSYIQKSPTAPLEEIRRVLSDSNGEELDLLGGSQNGKALKDLLDYIDLLSSRSNSINLGTMVNERFSRFPYGWKELDTVLLVCRLYKAGEIELSAGGAKLQANEIYAQLDGSAKWNRVTISRRKTVEKADILAVRKLARDLFEKTAPEGEDDLFKYLSEMFAAVASNLQAWAGLAENGTYPGRDEIADLRGFIGKLQLNRDSYTFLRHVKANGDSFDNFSERYGRLRSFYESQKPQWDALRHAHDREFKPNDFFLRKDPDARAALVAVRSILHDPKPYGRIKECAPLIEILRIRNEAVVVEQRAQALGLINPLIESVKADLDKIGVEPTFSNTCLKPLQDIRKQVEAEVDTGRISTLVTQAREAEDEAHDKIEIAVNAAANPASTVPTDIAEPSAALPVIPQTVIKSPELFKPRRQIRAAQLNKRPYLETLADVDAYLAALRNELEAALLANTRIEIL
ncbi:BREX system P-loop protein BrxC [Rhizobium sp. SU303]|uniref:BREX system P-loop protein BrxC n=1 Tax=Rhizobium sp. SU303 TaxID=3138065 RepID=UPI001E422B30|nr:BREX system P-loop protein BrxC [Rhizobium leguminosarum]UFW79631.1 BREX system P-loop protein BrxC [Rhizobium leguminosarum bv. viciae]